MKSPNRLWFSLIGVALVTNAVGGPAATIDNAALSNESDGTNWAAYGRTFSENHFSPLAQINAQNVNRLGLAWTLDLDVTNSITVPLAVDGVIYLAAGYSIVHAIDAKTGRLLWRYDPKVPEAAGTKLRAGWGIRGAAFWKGRVYVATHDGRLLALNASDGHLAWSAQTLDPKDGAFISGAPRAFNGKIIIGNAGGDFNALRGYISAYDAETGKMVWRFYVVPGQPGKKDHAASDEIMPKAAKTWTGQWWKLGGGGCPWNSITYDAKYNRIYFGTGNGSPLNAKLRSPQGGDNLFVASIVAVDADTGKYAWHYQTTPGDVWDYDAATDITLAQVNLEGKPRDVIFHASKNGFFYVIDRTDGRLISAEKLGTVTWAERVDLNTGRPVVAHGARYETTSILLWPSFQAVHHWLPQSYSPLTGLVYEPTLEMPSSFGDKGVNLTDWKPRPETSEFTGITLGDFDVPADAGKSVLKAWDPVTQKSVWQVVTPGISNGGTLATAGNLVIQGLADGYLHAYSGDQGKDLWSYFAGVAVTGVPITYSVDGEQYITVTSGPIGGASGSFGSISGQWGWSVRVHPRRLLTFKLDGTAKLPPTAPAQKAKPLEGAEFELDLVKARAGAQEFVRCSLCHGPSAVAGGNAPDLRASAIPLSAEAFAAVVRDGALLTKGMPQFSELSDSQLESLRHYLRAKARGAGPLDEPATSGASKQ